MELGACVLLPEGFDEHPEARYPLIVFHGHFPRHVRRLPGDPARPGPQARLQRALPARGLQPDPAGIRLPVLQGLDGPGLPAGHHHRNPARQSLLRRLLRRQLGQPRPLRRRHRPRAHPLRRKEVPRDRPGLGALHLRRLDRRLGGAGRPGLLPRRVQRLLRRLPRPDRFPGLHGRQHLRAQERLLRRRPVEEDAPARPAELSRRGQRDPRAGQSPGAGPRRPTAGRAINGTSGRPSSARSARTAIPSRSGTS